MKTDLQEMTELMEFWRTAYRKQHAELLKLRGYKVKGDDDYILVGGAKCYTGKKVK